MKRNGAQAERDPGQPAGRATSSGGKRLLWVEVGRGIAAVAVVCSHMPPLPGWIGEPLGAMGVEFFFLLSGFIILHVHRRDIGQAQALPRFAWRRVGRIFPIYWAVLVAVFLLEFIALKPEFRPPLEFGYIAQQALLLSGGHPLIGPSWTLRHELLFYAMFAVLIVNRRLGIGLMALWAAAILAWLPVLGGGVQPTQQGVQILLHHYNLDFFLGMAVALLERGTRLGRFCVAALVVAAGLFALHAAVADGPDSFIKVFAFKCAFLGALSAAVLLSRTRFRPVGVLTLLGAASYSIYLINRDVGFFYGRIVRQLGLTLLDESWLGFCVAVSVAVGLGVAIHLVLEKPMLRWVNTRRWARPRGGPSADRP